MPASPTLADIFSTPGAASAFSDEALLRAMCAFEGALAHALAQSKVIPEDHARAIEAACSDFRIEPAAVVAAARTAGTLVIPFVAELTKHVAARDPAAARSLHVGATSQDVIDTALVLCARVAHRQVSAQLTALGDCVKAEVVKYRDTPAIARTLLQPATPIPFGLRLAGWLHLLSRARANLARSFGSFGVLQLGGASGSLAGYAAEGPAIAAALGRRLDLPVPVMPWHGARDDVARLGSELSILCGCCGKMGLDIALMAQPEINEVAESSSGGRGGSSAMPHKRNPAGSLLALEAANRAPSLALRLLSNVTTPLERGLGTWQYDFWTMGELYGAASSALAAMTDVLENWSVNTEALRQNIEQGGGLVYSEALALALSPAMGKAPAAERMRQCCELALKAHRPLAAVAAEDAAIMKVLSPQALKECFAPETQWGSAPAFIDNALAEWGGG